MTDHVTPLSDEVLSAYLDGEGPPEVGERIAADPEAQARMGSLAVAASALTGEPVIPLPPATVDNLVAQAMTAAPGGDQSTMEARTAEALAAGGQRTPMVGADGRGDGSGVVPLAPRRSGRGRAAPPAWLVAAVVLLVVAVGVGLVVAGRNGGRRESASPTSSETGAFDGSGNRSPSGTSGAGSNRGQDSASPGSASASESPKVLPDHGAPAPGPNPTTTASDSSAVPAPLSLGSFPSADALRTALATSFPAQSTPSPENPATAPSMRRCADQVRVTLALKGQPLHQGYASVAGTTVLVYEFASTSFRDQRPTTLLAAVGAAACNPVVTFER